MIAVCCRFVVLLQCILCRDYSASA